MTLRSQEVVDILPHLKVITTYVRENSLVDIGQKVKVRYIRSFFAYTC